MSKRFTTEEFIEKARQVHGDRYDYSKVEYGNNNRDKVVIICPLHGEFLQTPKQHLKGSGCSKCKYKRGYKTKYSEIPDEVWKPIKKFEDLYKISNKGRLMSSSSGEWMLLSNTNTKGDYFSVILRKGKYRKSTRIHRLVYESFIGDIPKGFYVHHINGNKQDNRVENLKLVSPEEHSKEHYIEILERAKNRNYGIEDGNINTECKYLVQDGKIIGLNPNYAYPYDHNKNKKRGKTTSFSQKEVEQYTLEGVFIARFVSAKDAYRKTGVCARNILQVANKEPYNDKGFIRKQAGGYVWKLAE